MGGLPDICRSILLNAVHSSKVIRIRVVRAIVAFEVFVVMPFEASVIN
jgi:hypothetical protein